MHCFTLQYFIIDILYGNSVIKQTLTNNEINLLYSIEEVNS
jgi:hypothetical protein